MQLLQYKARAKVNLALDVCRRLENGYHEIRTVMQTVNIYDELEFCKRRDPDIILQVDSKDYLGDLENNLIFRAAKLMKEQYSIQEGIEIHLKKNIPVAAGMAGGSTDAATTMIAMNELFGLSRSREQLMEQAVQLGADIPFCVLGGTALAEGIGEKLTPLPAPPHAALLVVKPDIMVATKWVYENLHIDKLKRHPDIDGLVKALQQENLAGIAQHMENVMETVTAKKYPIIMKIKSKMLERGAVNAVMSGSGPSVFGIFTKKETAKAAETAIRQMFDETKIKAQVQVTEFYNDTKGDIG